MLRSVAMTRCIRPAFICNLRKSLDRLPGFYHAGQMAIDYNTLYGNTPHAMGPANPDVVAFFQDRPPVLKVLDIGCGQGRDALAIADMGHSVHGIDLSSNGVSQMLAEAGDLPVTGEVGDIRDYQPTRMVDVLLIDRTLHMLPEAADRATVLTRLLDAVVPGGWLLLLDEPSNMAGLKAAIETHSTGWDIRFQGRPRRKGRPETGILFARLSD